MTHFRPGRYASGPENVVGSADRPDPLTWVRPRCARALTAAEAAAPGTADAVPGVPEAVQS